MENNENDFDTWNVLKKRIEDNRTESGNVFPKEGEVWACMIGKNIGWEQDGKGSNFSRPVLILKKFNNQMSWIIPLSSKQKNIDFYSNFTDPYNRNVSAILAQLKLISVKRLERRIYIFPQKHLKEIKDKLKFFLQ